MEQLPIRGRRAGCASRALGKEKREHDEPPAPPHAEREGAKQRDCTDAGLPSPGHVTTAAAPSLQLNSIWRVHGSILAAVLDATIGRAAIAAARIHLVNALLRDAAVLDVAAPIDRARIAV